MVWSHRIFIIVGSWLALNLAGCGMGLVMYDPPSVYGDDDDDDDDDDDTQIDTDTGLQIDTSLQAGNISIDSVEPSFGSNVGGDTVVITGGPFDESASVYLGSDKADIDMVLVDEITITTPSSTETGTVDVTVVTSDDSGVMSNGFSFLSDGTGLTGLLGEFSWYRYAGGYWSPDVDYGEAWLTFLDPTTIEPWEIYGTALDTCSTSTPSIDANVLDFGGTEVVLSSSSGSDVTLPWIAANGMYINASNLTSSEYSTDTSYDLSSVTGAESLNLATPGFLQTPSVFNLVQPVIDGNTPNNIKKDNINLQWDGTAGDAMVFIMYTEDSNNNIQDFITCVAEDDGSFLVDSSYWSTGDWGATLTFFIQAGRMVVQSATLPYNGSETKMAGVYWNIGALYTTN